MKFSAAKTHQFKWVFSYETIVLVIALYFALVLNYPVIKRIYELSTHSHIGFSLSPFLLLTGCFIVIFSLFAAKYVFKPVMVLMLMTSAAAMYAMLQYNVMFDYAMIENVFETNSGEAISYVNFSSIGYVALFGGLPSLLLCYTKIQHDYTIKQWLLRRFSFVVVGLMICAVVLALFYKDYVFVGRNNSYLNKMIIPAHVFNSVKYLNKTYFTQKLTFDPIGQDAQLIPSNNDKPTLMVMVVGETARAQNMAHNGYERNTNPYTQDEDLIALQQVSSCGTATAHSLPCMFSILGHDNFKRDKADAKNNVLDIMQIAGVKVAWYESDGGDKGVAKRVNKMIVSATDNPAYCNGLTCYDEVLVEQLKLELAQDIDSQLASNSAAQLDNHFVALHTIGSHGPTYWQRYPENKAVFSPVCNRSDIENCTDEEIINVYDNTIVYTDFVLAQTIDVLKQYQDKYNVVMVYVSDHGESLGEKGIYLHGTPYAFAPAEQTHVPWFIWLGQDYAQAKGINRSCLEDLAKHGKFSHDNLFHTLLGLFGVSTAVKQQDLDITAACKLG